MYDYLIVGAGLFGAVFAYEANKRGKKCLVIDRRGHVGGNVFTEEIEQINVHKYGAHIFHTNDEKIWKYINEFSNFNSYINMPIAVYKEKVYNLPFNMNTFYSLWGIKYPYEAKQKILDEVKKIGINAPKNLEEQALMLVGKEIYEKLIKGYTEKQWGKKACELPSFIIKRIPLRFTYDNNYYNDRYQGIPCGGYTKIFEKMLHGIEIRLNTDFFTYYKNYNKLARKIVFTGAIDEFFGYSLGALEYRSLVFKHELLDMPNYQGNAVVNFTDKDIPYTRIIEHKHFEFGSQPKTIITKEYPVDWKQGDEPYYPINDEKNTKLLGKYKGLAASEPNVIFGGRLGSYKYYNMDQVINAALECVHRELI